MKTTTTTTTITTTIPNRNDNDRQHPPQSREEQQQKQHAQLLTKRQQQKQQLKNQQQQQQRSTNSSLSSLWIPVSSRIISTKETTKIITSSNPVAFLVLLLVVFLLSIDTTRSTHEMIIRVLSPSSSSSYSGGRGAGVVVMAFSSIQQKNHQHYDVVMLSRRNTIFGTSTREDKRNNNSNDSTKLRAALFRSFNTTLDDDVHEISRSRRRADTALTASRRKKTMTTRTQQESQTFQTSTKIHDAPSTSSPRRRQQHFLSTIVVSSIMALMVMFWSSSSSFLGSSTSAVAEDLAPTTDSNAIVSCLFRKCALPLGKCISNPKCLANVICIQSCTGKSDEIGCQIECGNLFENDVVGIFNKCAVSDMTCVPKQGDDGSYPAIITKEQQDKMIANPIMDVSFWTGRWYITAGQNKLFDTFDCQVHFFQPTSSNQFAGKLNWRITEPDGEFFTRNALQEFRQDPAMQTHWINDNNEYLHYSDDWWIIDYEPDITTTSGGTSQTQKTPPFAFVYYRGSNDAWDGYGGAVIYTRDSKLPESLIPRLRIAANKIGFNFDRDFVITDNTCPADLKENEKVLLREKFVGNVALQTEKQVQVAMTRFRGNVVNTNKARQIFFENRMISVERAFNSLEQQAIQFEQEIINNNNHNHAK